MNGAGGCGVSPSGLLTLLRMQLIEESGASVRAQTRTLGQFDRAASIVLGRLLDGGGMPEVKAGRKRRVGRKGGGDGAEAEAGGGNEGTVG